MTNQMSQEDKDFLDKFLNELKNIGIPGGEAYLSKLGEYVSKMPNTEIAHFGKLFRLYGYTGVFFAIQDSIKQGSADPLYKYALGTIATIAAAPFVVGTGKAVLAAIVLSYLVNKSWEAGEWLAENQEEIIKNIKDALSDASIFIDESGIITIPLQIMQQYLPSSANGENMCLINPNIKDLFDGSELIKSPLVLDLDADGVETTGLGSNIFFDHDKNGFAENSGYIINTHLSLNTLNSCPYLLFYSFGGYICELRNATNDCVYISA